MKEELKDKRLNVKISGIELNFLQKNLPPEFDNLSDYVRTIATEGIKSGISSGKIQTDGASLDPILEKLDEYVEKIVFEIQQNRALLTGVQDIVQSVSRKKSDRLKQLSINELVQHYLEHQDSIKMYDDFAANVKFTHLNDFVIAAIDELAAKKLITLKNERVIWHEV